MLVRAVVHHEIRDDPQPARVGGVEESLKVLDVPVGRMDAEEVGDVVPVVLQRRGIHREDPQAVDAEILDVVEMRRQPREVADAVAVGVEERLHVDFVEDRVLVPVLAHLVIVPAGRSARGSRGA